MDGPAEYLYFSAMETGEYRQIPIYSRVVAGHNHYGPGYHVLRASGTNDYVMQVTLAGCGYFAGAGALTALPAGSVAIIPPLTAHDYGTHPESREWDVVWIHFHHWKHWEPLLERPPESSGVILLDMDDSTTAVKARKAFLRVLHHYLSKSPQRIAWAMNALEQGLLYCAEMAPMGAGGSFDGRLDKAIEFMHAHLGQSMSVADMAAVAGLSPFYFAHLFRANLKMPPLRYLEQLRLDRARDLLARTGLSMAQIADQLGFSDPFYFSRRFQKANGMSPREFRQRATS